MTSDDPTALLPEQRARIRIDAMLSRPVGWCRNTRPWKLVTHAGLADHVLFVNRQALGVIEANGEHLAMIPTNPPFGKKLSVAIVTAEGKVRQAEDEAPGVTLAEIVEDLQAALAAFTELAEPPPGHRRGSRSGGGLNACSAVFAK